MGVLILVLNFSVTLSLEAKLHLLHSYMNVKWITLPCDMQVTGRGVFSSLFNYSEPLSTGQQPWAPPWLALLLPTSAALSREMTRFLCLRFSQSFSCPFLLFVVLACPAGQLLWGLAARATLLLPRQTQTVGLGRQKLPRDPRFDCDCCFPGTFPGQESSHLLPKHCDLCPSQSCRCTNRRCAGSEDAMPQGSGCPWVPRVRIRWPPPRQHTLFFSCSFSPETLGKLRHLQMRRTLRETPNIVSAP